MIKSPIEKDLLNIGFSTKEAEVYLALLNLGRGTVSQIARRANINRTTGYDILAHLINKGLVSISGKEPKQEYAAESPDKILKVVENERKQIETRLVEAKELIPQLKSLHNTGGRPKIRFYEGEEGLVEVYEDTLTSQETIRAYANVDDMNKALPNYFPKYYKRRSGKGIHIRAIFPDNEAGRERSIHNSDEARESASIPSDKFYFSPEINIYDDKVMIASLKEKLGIIIQSKEIAEAMKAIYELAWTEAKRLDAEMRAQKQLQ